VAGLYRGRLVVFLFVFTDDLEEVRLEGVEQWGVCGWRIPAA